MDITWKGFKLSVIEVVLSNFEETAASEICTMFTLPFESNTSTLVFPGKDTIQ